MSVRPRHREVDERMVTLTQAELDAVVRIAGHLPPLTVVYGSLPVGKRPPRWSPRVAVDHDGVVRWDEHGYPL